MTKKPLARNSLGAPYFIVERGKSSRRVLLNTIPKSGTYMVARLLEELGLANTHIHFVNEGYYDFRDEAMEAIVADPDRFYEPAALGPMLDCVLPGQFAVAHIEYRADLPALDDFAHLFCIRDIRDALISQMRFVSRIQTQSEATRSWSGIEDERLRFAEFLRCVGRDFVNYARGFLPWLENARVVVCRFETLSGDHGVDEQRELLGAIAETVGSGPIGDPLQLFLTRVHQQSTRTFSGSRSSRDRYFSPRAEELCAECGVGELNAALGYT